MINTTFYVERIHMLGGGLYRYRVWEELTETQSWATSHVSQCTINNKRVGELTSRRIPWLNDTDFPPCTDRRFNMVHAWYKGLEKLTAILIRLAYPETRSIDPDQIVTMMVESPVNRPHEVRNVYFTGKHREYAVYKVEYGPGPVTKTLWSSQ